VTRFIFIFIFLFALTANSANSLSCKDVVAGISNASSNQVFIKYKEGHQPTELDFKQVGWLKNFEGQPVTVKFMLYDEGGRVQVQESNPTVTRVSALDEVSKEVIDGIRDQAKQALNSGGFRESSAWLIYTSKGVYQSEPLLSSEFEVNAYENGKDFEALLQKIQLAEGSNFLIEDIEFFHTHRYESEPFSPGDESNLGGYLSWLYKRQTIINPHNILPEISNMSFHSVGLEGDTLFRKTYAIRKNRFR